MGLFDRIFRPTKNKEMQKAVDQATTTFKLLNYYEPVFRSWDGCIYEAQMVRAAIDAISRHCAKLKIVLKGSAKPKLKALLSRRPNTFQTWYQFLAQTATILFTNNTVFICPMYNEEMEITGYLPLLPSSVSLIEYKDAVWLKYKFQNGDIGACKWDDCAVLTRFLYDNPLFGSSNDALKETMSLIKLNSEAIKEAVKNSNSFRFMAQSTQLAKDLDLTAEQKNFSELNFKKEKNNGILIFPSTYKDIKQIDSKPLTVDTKQMELIDANIQKYFGVSKEIMMNTAKGDELDAFYNGQIEGFSIQFSESMTGAIYSDREISQGNELMALSNRLQYMNTSQKIEMARQLGDRGAILIDEIRELFNYPPLPDGAGQHAPIRGEYYMHDEENKENDDEKNE